MKKLLIASVSVLALSASAAFATDSTATITQDGSTNTASVEQIAGGSTNTAEVNQAGYGNVTIQQTNGGAVQSATVNQYGIDDGSATAAVTHTLTGYDVSAGAKIYQNSGLSSGSTAANTAVVDQYSNTHGALVIQGGEGGSNDAYVYQGADSIDPSTLNTASVVQDTGTAGATNVATINQNTLTGGGSNLAMVYQH